MQLKYFIWIIVLFSLSYSVSAFAGGNGTLANPYQIENCQSFRNISFSLSSYYTIINDIDCTTFAFTPISTSTAFTGGIEGNKRVVKNINMTGAGLFISLNTYGNISNILFENINFTCNTNNCGFIAGTINRGRLENISISGVINSAYAYTGGLIGILSSNGYIIDCANHATIFGSNQYTAGIVGISTTVSGYISGCYNGGNIYGSSFTGGIAGRFASGVMNTTFNYGRISGGTQSGAIVGYNTFACVACYYDSNYSGTGLQAYAGTPLTTENMWNESQYVNNTFTNRLNISSGSYPYFFYENLTLPIGYFYYYTQTPSSGIFTYNATQPFTFNATFMQNWTVKFFANGTVYYNNTFNSSSTKLITTITPSTLPNGQYYWYFEFSRGLNSMYRSAQTQINVGAIGGGGTPSCIITISANAWFSPNGCYST